MSRVPHGGGNAGSCSNSSSSTASSSEEERVAVVLSDEAAYAEPCAGGWRRAAEYQSDSDEASSADGRGEKAAALLVPSSRARLKASNDPSRARAAAVSGLSRSPLSAAQLEAACDDEMSDVPLAAIDAGADALDLASEDDVAAASDREASRTGLVERSAAAQLVLQRGAEVEPVMPGSGSARTKRSGARTQRSVAAWEPDIELEPPTGACCVSVSRAL